MPRRRKAQGQLLHLLLEGDRAELRRRAGAALEDDEEGDDDALTNPFPRQRVEDGALVRHGLRRAATEDKDPTTTIPDQREIVAEDGTIILPPPPGHINTSWHDEFCRILAASGMLRQACLLIGVSVATVRKHRERFPEFDAKVRAATEEATELLFQVGWEMAVEERDPDMLKHYQKALDPRFATRKVVEHQLSAQDRRLIEQQARAAGVDPQRVFARLQQGKQAGQGG